MPCCPQNFQLCGLETVILHSLLEEEQGSQSYLQLKFTLSSLWFLLSSYTVPGMQRQGTIS